MKRLRQWFHRPRVVVVNLTFSGSSAAHVRSTVITAVKAELAKLNRGDTMRLHVSQSARADDPHALAQQVNRALRDQQRQRQPAAH